jgi:hypothetical protein
MSEEPRRQKRRTTISIPEELLEKGETRARQANRTFSNYIETLIWRDTGELLQAGEGDK